MLLQSWDTCCAPDFVPHFSLRETWEMKVKSLFHYLVITTTVASFQQRLHGVTSSPAGPSDSGTCSLCNCAGLAHTQEIQQVQHASEADIQMAPGRDIWLWKQWAEEQSGLCGFVVSVHQNIAWPFSWDILHAVCIPLTFQTVGGQDLSLYCGWCLVFTLTHIFFFILWHAVKCYSMFTVWNML